MDKIEESADELAISNFRKYLQIESVQPNINYGECVSFLENQADSLGLPFRVYYCIPDKPIVVITWAGADPNLPTILLNSHMDVVPVFEENWTYNPFGADLDKEGNVYARGAQDMKCVGIQYLEAIRRLKQEKVTLKRTIHISFVPDEEIGGIEGMGRFVQSNYFKDLNVGFALDEGMASANDQYELFYGERTSWKLMIRCPGQPGHGSLLLDNTAGEKVRKVLDKIIDFRDQEKKKLEKSASLTIGDVTTLNVTQLRGGVQANVIPPELAVVIDCRIPITVNLAEFETTLSRWCKEAGEGVWIDYIRKQPQVPATKIDYSNPFWAAFKKAADELNLKLRPQIFSGATDSRYIREMGIPAIGFSPMNNTPVRLHDNDEYLNKDVFLRGITIYCKIFSAIANTE